MRLHWCRLSWFTCFHDIHEPEICGHWVIHFTQFRSMACTTLGTEYMKLLAKLAYFDEA